MWVEFRSSVQFNKRVWGSWFSLMNVFKSYYDFHVVSVWLSFHFKTNNAAETGHKKRFNNALVGAGRKNIKYLVWFSLSTDLIFKIIFWFSCRFNFHVVFEQFHFDFHLVVWANNGAETGHKKKFINAVAEACHKNNIKFFMSNYSGKLRSPRGVSRHPALMGNCQTL